MRIQSTVAPGTRTIRPRLDTVPSEADGALHGAGSLPDRPPPSKIDSRVTMAFDPDRAEARIVRDLRAEILAKVPEQPRLRPWTVALVALDAGSDVGVIAANLAVSFALLDQRTIVIEADFAGPVQASLFCIDADVGLVDVFQSAPQIDNAIYPTAIDNLEVVPLGESSGVNNVDAVAKKSLVETLDVVLRHANIVIIPTSGLSIGSLSSVLADVDLVVPVARRAHTKMRDLKGFVTMAEAQGINTCGIVLSN